MSEKGNGTSSTTTLPCPSDLANRQPAVTWKLRKVFKSTSHKQLDNTLGPFELELTNLIAVRKKDSTKEVSPWAEDALQMLKCAQKSLELGEIQLGWGFFYKAELLSLHLMDDGMLQERATIILNKAEERLDEQEKKNVRDLIGKSEKGIWQTKPNVTINEVYSALSIVQKHYIDAYTALDTAMFQLGILAGIALLLSPFIILSLMITPWQKVISNWWLLPAVLFGAMGGAISGVITTATGLTKEDIPQMLLSSWVSVVRPIVGAAAALAISMFLLAGLVNLGEVTDNLIFAVAFASGFSERVLLKTVEKVG